MKQPRTLRAVILLTAVQLACTTVYRPPDEPVDEAALAAAIATIDTSDARVAMLEDGLQADVYRYEWRELPEPIETHFASGRLYEPAGRPSQRIRMLGGRRHSVYLRYSSILAVEARSWPMWAGVEIRVAGASDPALAGPLVIQVADAEEAERLTDAIDCLRRARLGAEAAAPEPAEPDRPPD